VANLGDAFPGRIVMLVGPVEKRDHGRGVGRAALDRAGLGGVGMTRSKRLISRLFGGVAIAGGIAAALSVTVLPSAEASSVSSVKITSFTIKGTAAAPEIVVKGSGFGKTAPPADPASHPNGQDGCPAFPANPPKYIANDGYDYGSNMLYLWDTTAAWRAGDYVAGGELDCIGLRIVKWTRTEIEFRPGTAYDHPKLENGNTYILAKGDAVQVDVRGTTAKITY
jgi:hypothetical protein